MPHRRRLTDPPEAPVAFFRVRTRVMVYTILLLTALAFAIADRMTQR